MLNGIEKVKIWKSVCEKVFSEGLLVSFMFLNVKKNFPLFHLFQCGKPTFPPILGSVPDTYKFLQKRNPTIAPPLPFCSFFYPRYHYSTRKIKKGDGWVGFFVSPFEGWRAELHGFFQSFSGGFFPIHQSIFQGWEFAHSLILLKSNDRL